MKMGLSLLILALRYAVSTSMDMTCRPSWTAIATVTNTAAVAVGEEVLSRV